MQPAADTLATFSSLPMPSRSPLTLPILRARCPSVRSLTWLAVLSLAGCDSVGIEPPGQEASVSWPEMLDAVNGVRAEARTCGGERYPAVAPLVWNGRLEAAAERHSADMAERGFFGHTGSDGSGPGTRASQAGYSWRSVAENIARTNTSVGVVVEAWVESPGHCHNLMDPRFAEMGAAEEGGLWTQLFAAPR